MCALTDILSLIISIWVLIGTLVLFLFIDYTQKFSGLQMIAFVVLCGPVAWFLAIGVILSEPKR